MNVYKVKLTNMEVDYEKAESSSCCGDVGRLDADFGRLRLPRRLRPKATTSRETGSQRSETLCERGLGVRLLGVERRKVRMGDRQMDETAGRKNLRTGTLEKNRARTCLGQRTLEAPLISDCAHYYINDTNLLLPRLKRRFAAAANLLFALCALQLFPATAGCQTLADSTQGARATEQTLYEIISLRLADLLPTEGPLDSATNAQFPQ